MFDDRDSAGRELGRRLAEEGFASALILGVPRGGVIVAAAAAQEMGAPLDVIVTAKVRAPGHPELGLGAVGPGGVVTLDNSLIRRLGVTDEYLAGEIEERRGEVDRRISLYRDRRGPIEVAARDALVVDDGIATGGTARSAVAALRMLEPNRVVVAVPVCARETAVELAGHADLVICLETPSPFLAVGSHYVHFEQVGDEQVRSALEEVWDGS